MTDRAIAEIPLEIDRIESSRADPGTIRLHLAGRWLDPAGAGEEELLVVQVQGRRHRFPATRDPEAPGSQDWSASFELPAWAEPRHAGQAALWIGTAVIPVPPGTEPPADAAPEPPADAMPEPPAYPAPETPRSGPLADLLLKETVAALHEELERRTAELARVRGTLADAESDLGSRAAVQAALEATHGELRAQLERLTEAVESGRAELARRTSELEQERAELSGRLAELSAARDEQAGELAGIAQRHAAELAALREQQAAAIASLRDQLTRAQAGEDRAAVEVSRLREAVASASVARDAAVSEAAGLRSELARLGTELAATRERVSAESGDLGEAQRLLADARALADELGGGHGSG